MSIALLNELRSKNAGKVTTRAVVKSLCQFCDDGTNVCNPSLSQLLLDTGIGSKVTLLSCLRELEDIGVIDRFRVSTSRTTKYVLHLNRLPSLIPESTEESGTTSAMEELFIAFSRVLEERKRERKSREQHMFT